MANPIGMDALFIVDDEYNKAALQLLMQTIAAQGIWDSYIDISGKIVGGGGALAGAGASAYEQFVALADTHVAKRLVEIAQKCNGDMRGYISAIDDADSVIY